MGEQPSYIIWNARCSYDNSIIKSLDKVCSQRGNTMAKDLAAQLIEQKRKVDFDTFDITVKELIAMVRDKLVDIAPDYQRQFRWGSDGQSRFIESVFLGIPIPSLFMAANQDGTWELIDGVQRLSTLIHFAGDGKVHQRLGIEEPLTLSSLEKLDSFNGETFHDPAQVLRTPW